MQELEAMHGATESWMEISRPIEKPTVRLLCWPHAGGSWTMYRRWWPAVGASIEVAAATSAGGCLAPHQPEATVTEVVRAMLRQQRPTDDVPVALFGHSMGAVMAYHFAHAMRDEWGFEPAAIFAAGCVAPDSEQHRLGRNWTNEDIERVADEHWGGWPDALRSPSRLQEAARARVRADLQLLGAAAHRRTPPLSCPIFVFGGLSDRWAPARELQRWSEYTRGRMRMTLLPGDHMFVRSGEKPLVRQVARQLATLFSSSSECARAFATSKEVY
jgi:surfactin synthase thioesterase subunit